ncbi:MAG: hypothetical protein KME35_08080 [Aphanocapsa sp. GSE-SYN-MK-11-07L]|jgi:hypothetical protein|nr:hypothetical protein [Aphanocapsa sp. GSE-SYN-MK-11-07L]
MLVEERIWLALSTPQDQAALRGERDWTPEQEWKRYVQRQTLLQQVIFGNMHPDDLLDCLLDHDLSPDDYLDQVDDGLRPLC